MTDPIVWYTRCPLPTAFSVALHRGFLENRLAGSGVRVESLRHAADPAVRLSHFTHTLPGMMRHGGHIPPLWSRASGRDVRLIGLSWTNEAQYVLALPDSGIAGAAGLKGRRLAVPRRPNYPIDFWRATVLKGFADTLATVGLRLDDVTLVDLPVEDHPFREATVGTQPLSPPGAAKQTLSSMRQEAFALIRGTVDAVFAPGHYGVALKAFLGAVVVSDLATLPDRFGKLNNPTLLAFTVDGAFLDRHPDAVGRVLASALEAADWAADHRRDVARIVAAETGNPEELVEEIFGTDFADDLAPRLDDSVIEALDRQNQFLFRNGFVPRVVPIGEWLAREPLEAARSRHAGRRATEPLVAG